MTAIILHVDFASYLLRGARTKAAAAALAVSVHLSTRHIGLSAIPAKPGARQIAFAGENELPAGRKRVIAVYVAGG